MSKTAYSVEELKALRSNVEGVPPPKCVTATGAFDSEHSKRDALTRNRASSDEFGSGRGLPPKQLSHDNFGGREFFGAGSNQSSTTKRDYGTKDRSKEASPASTMWVYRTKGSDQVSQSMGWADVQALIDDMLVEQDEIELRPANLASTTFMAYDDAMAYRSGKVSAPTSPDANWRSSAGQQRYGQRERPPPRIPSSPSFGEAAHHAPPRNEDRAHQPQNHHSSHHSSHHHNSPSQYNQNQRSSWTREDMATRPQPVHSMQALGTDIDELNLGIGTLPISTKPRSVETSVDIGGDNSVSSEPLSKASPSLSSGPPMPPGEIGSPSKQAVSEAKPAGAPMPMLCAPIGLGDPIGGGSDSTNNFGPDPVENRPKPLKKKYEKRSAEPSPMKKNHKDASTKNAWGTASGPQVDFQAVLNDTPKKGGIASPKTVGGDLVGETWGLGGSGGGGSDLPTLGDVASAPPISKKAQKEAKLNKHPPMPQGALGGDDNFWEGGNTASSGKGDAFPSLDSLGASPKKK